MGKEGLIRKYFTERSRRVAFEQLRRQVHRKQEEDLEQRKARGLRLTELEEQLGVPLEEIEPQVRAAVIVFNARGYPTEDSGFEEDPRSQRIAGSFDVDAQTQTRLREMNVEVLREPNWRMPYVSRGDRPSVPEHARYTTTISFRPESPDLSAIKKRWGDIAVVLPVVGERRTNWWFTDEGKRILERKRRFF
jgi:hypothetical protein